jgi:2-iminobutanoate/2-iminopropanoate deaminase
MTVQTARIETGSPLEKQLGCSQAVRAGNHVFVSGQMSLDETGQVLHSGDLGAQFKRTLENVRSVLQKVGASMDDVVMEYFFLTQFPTEHQFVEICEAHRTAYGGTNQPTGTMVYVPKLPVPGAMVEITAVAVIS